jgi:HEPN domain-containing protein
MKRKDFHLLAQARLKDAQALFQAGRSPGAYYLAGYSVECALKACIARRIERHTFPDKQLATSVYTHELEKLVKLAGLDIALGSARADNANLDAHWAVVKDWNEAARYRHDITASMATDMVRACSARKVGVLAWLKTHW